MYPWYPRDTAEVLQRQVQQCGANNGAQSSSSPSSATSPAVKSENGSAYGDCMADYALHAKVTYRLPVPFAYAERYCNLVNGSIRINTVELSFLVRRKNFSSGLVTKRTSQIQFDISYYNFKKQLYCAEIILLHVEIKNAKFRSHGSHRHDTFEGRPIREKSLIPHTGLSIPGRLQIRSYG